MSFCKTSNSYNAPVNNIPTSKETVICKNMLKVGQCECCCMFQSVFVSNDFKELVLNNYSTNLKKNETKFKKIER